MHLTPSNSNYSGLSRDAGSIVCSTHPHHSSSLVRTAIFTSSSVAILNSTYVWAAHEDDKTNKIDIIACIWFFNYWTLKQPLPARMYTKSGRQLIILKIKMWVIRLIRASILIVNIYWHIQANVMQEVLENIRTLQVLTAKMYILMYFNLPLSEGL